VEKEEFVTVQEDFCVNITQNMKLCIKVQCEMINMKINLN